VLKYKIYKIIIIIIIIGSTALGGSCPPQNIWKSSHKCNNMDTMAIAMFDIFLVWIQCYVTMGIKPTSAYENMRIYYILIIVNLLHVSATYCCHPQEGVFMKYVRVLQPMIQYKIQIKLLCWIYMSKKRLWVVRVTSLSWNTKICVCRKLVIHW